MGRNSRTSTRADARARDLSRLAARYGWSPEEMEKVRVQLELHPDFIQKYWRNLAIARAAGFVQSQENGFLTLRAWCAATGRCDPTLLDLLRD